MQLLQTWDKFWIDLDSSCYMHNLDVNNMNNKHLQPAERIEININNS